MAVRGTAEWRANISAARKLQVGEDAPRWMGDRAKPESIKVRGRREARRLFAVPERCERCNRKLEIRRGGYARHHIDGDTTNNLRSNIKFLCQSCHMVVDNPRHRKIRKGVVNIARVKYDVSKAEARNFQVPKPDVYEAAIREMSHGDSSSGNPMFTIVFEIVKGEHKDARVWYYILTDGSQEWRLREFTDAVGLPPKGTIDTDALTGTVVQIKTAVDPAKDGYDEKARIKNVLPAAGTKGGDEEEPPYEEWELADLKEEVEARELKISGKATKKKLVDALNADDEEEGSEEDEEEDEDAKGSAEEEEDEDEEDEEEGPTLAEVKKMDRTELKELIKEEELEVKVTRKMSDDDLRAKVVEALELEEDEEEEGDDEDTNYEEWDVSDLKAELKDRGLDEKGRRSALIARLKKDDEGDGDEPF